MQLLRRIAQGRSLTNSPGVPSVKSRFPLTAKLLSFVLLNASDNVWENSSRRGRLLLHALSFLATAVALWSVGAASNQLLLHSGLIALAAVGHASSWLVIRWRPRLSFINLLVVLVAIWLMRVDLLAVLSGGSLLPFARLLASYWRCPASICGACEACTT